MYKTYPVSITTYVYNGEDEFQVEVTGDYYPGDPGFPSSNPDMFDPPTCSEVQNICATWQGKPFALSAAQLDDLETELLEKGDEEYYSQEPDVECY